MRVQFIVKQYNKECDNGGYSVSGKSGVYLSAKFLSDMLNESGIESIVSEALDNNCIDKLVTEFKPDIVIIEAYWVVPSKFDILTSLHPNIKWVIRNHSAMSFLAEEGIIIDWSFEYIKNNNVYLASNHYKTYTELCEIGKFSFAPVDKILYLPNYYPENLIKSDRRPIFSKKDEIHIGCFGANRSLKNQLVQAYAAIKFSKDINRKLYFHMNNSYNNPIVKNITSLFENVHNVELVLHDWMPHEKFYELCGQMDLGMQLSYSETFNIIAADFVANDVPLIVSDEIDFVSKIFRTNSNDGSRIIKTIRRIFSIKKHIPFFNRNQILLKSKVRKAKNQWLRIINS